mmetsp:Transcript_16070/g.27123  ORF Transcript_16070/g.27123 Transcript_16070/m.27123 type:complete len:293 (+) Transcript_16070:231-1109(+)
MGRTIGSIKNRQINFSSEHKFFSKEQHMKPSAQILKEVIKEEIDKDLLGTKPQKWNQSVNLPRSKAGHEQEMGGTFQDLNNNHQKFMISKGFFDETFCRTKPQTTYAGCDTRDVYYHGWDVSYETTPPRDKERQYQIERAFLLDKTSRISDNIIKKNNGKERQVYGIATNRYIKPEEISAKINTKLREEKNEEMQLWQELLEKARHEMPGASEQKLQAIVFSKIQNIKHGKKEEPDPELTFKPDISKSMGSKPPAPVKPKRRGMKGSTNLTGNSVGGGSKINQGSFDGQKSK